MKWIKPGGFAPYSTFLVNLDIPLDVEGAVKEDVDVVTLDPGGPIWNGVKHSQVDIEGYKFKIQRHVIGEVLHLMSKATEPLPGLRLFSMYLNQDVVMTTSLFDKLWNKLKEMAEDDETMHESLDAALLENKLNEHPNVMINVKKENPERE